MTSLKLEEISFLLGSDQLNTAVQRFGTLHAQLYSNKAARTDLITERLRWRGRLRSLTDPDTLDEIQKHLEALKNQSHNLLEQKRALEAEQTRIIEQLNFFGYTISLESGVTLLKLGPKLQK